MAFRVNGQGGAGGAPLSDATPEPTGSAVSASAGTSPDAARADHVHATEVTIGGITDAGPAGAAVLATETGAEALAALAAYGTLPDSGWTATTSGTATASRSGGVTTLTADSGGVVLHSLPGYIDPAAPAIDVVARFDYTSGAPATAIYLALGVFDTVSQQNGFLVQVSNAGIVYLFSFAGGTPSQLAFVGTVSVTSGTVWLRLVVTPAGIARAYHGSGSGPTPPSTWTYVGGGQSVSAITTAPLPLLCARLFREASGSGTYTVTISDLQVRVPGLSP